MRDFSPFLLVEINVFFFFDSLFFLAIRTEHDVNVFPRERLKSVTHHERYKKHDIMGKFFFFFLEM